MNRLLPGKKAVTVIDATSNCAASAAPGSERGLLQRLREGDEAAFDALYRQHYARVRGIAGRLVGSEADDLCQEVFLRLLERPPGQDANLAAWLARVTTNLGYNLLRAARRSTAQRTALGEQTEGQGWQAQAEDPEEQTRRSEGRALVQKVLSRLSRRQAAMLALRYSGMSYREIAAALGIASGSVGTLLARAERAFEKRYRQQSAADG
jgi:RNA polymerase sigma-70 factor (ECF subfamily)